MVASLGAAIRDGKLTIHYQPELDIQTKEVICVEALCRWYDEGFKQVAPDEFIPLAEAHHLIHDLGQEILRQVLQDMPQLLARWPQVRVAINVSSMELTRPEFAQDFIAILNLHNPAWAQHLEIEITESIHHSDLSTVRQNLLALKSQGMTVAIDDFGTGHSSLSILHSLPFDKIKMDKTFADELHQPMVQAIVQAMIDLANNFQRMVVMEGVETATQLETLISMGAHAVQGHFWSTPQPAAHMCAEFNLNLN
jgi:EAL domain-containing protein (putative c-di-GMP-specific phosphodiesterase class I)